METFFCFTSEVRRLGPYLPEDMPETPEYRACSRRGEGHVHIRPSYAHAFIIILRSAGVPFKVRLGGSDE